MTRKTKIMVVIGTRPEAIKMAPIVLALQKAKDMEPILCLTAQHREMLDQTLNIFGLHGDIDLNVMQANQSLCSTTSAILTRMDEVFQQHRPDWVLVQGDTTTVMTAALAAFYHHIPVGHVEAGLRSFNKWLPYPEEVNRRIAGVIADLHFAPTTLAQENLLREGANPTRCFVTGNTVIDALHIAVSLPFDWASSPLAALPLQEKRIITLTAHRRENHGAPLESICRAILKLAEQFKDVHFVYPVHLSPAVQSVVHSLLKNHPQISLLPPLDYLSMAHLLRASTLLLTDSGGLQEEAPGFGVPALVLRDVTERPEGVSAGNVLLVGTNQEKIVREVSRLLTNQADWNNMSHAVNPYGNGTAAEQILSILRKEQE